ncbi:hypothetical protein C7459_1465 [Tumebacillus permanentifrigoris]|uniref:Uncharacterized protein n=1 Tax=Tumebacillus permanentifrigoris TaxID=378543 RepID=A0A316DPA3_9BACL|nr:hypothetical protein C7459_1465 [Tumebacillus permanentifrigoris]
MLKKVTTVALMPIDTCGLNFCSFGCGVDWCSD